DMGVERDSLINQALFAFARQNGYSVTPTNFRPPSDAPAPRPASVAPPPPPTPPPPSAPPEPEESPGPAPAFFAAPASEGPPPTHSTGTNGVSAEPAPSGPMLVLYAEGREVDRVAGPRFLIGRGKHCDLIINSGK